MRLSDEEEVFDSDFQSTDDEAAHDEEAAAEKEAEEEERQERRVRMVLSSFFPALTQRIAVHTSTYSP